MTYVITENCIKCKYTDCVEVCPVDCFYEGKTMLVINPDECIDCGVCAPICPSGAILSDVEELAEAWVEVNRTYAAIWPNIARKRPASPESDQWLDRPGKAALLSPDPAPRRPGKPARKGVKKGTRKGAPPKVKE